MRGRRPRPGTGSRRRGVTRGQPLGTDRGQSEVVGVAVLLGVTLVALGTLTATIGTVVQQQAAGADATRVAADFEDALQPVEATGANAGTVSFTDGELAAVERQLRIYDGRHEVATVEMGALVYRNGERRVAFLAGAVVRGTGENARFAAPPPITVDEDVLVVGAPALNASGFTYATDGTTTLSLRSNVTHDRSALGSGVWILAIETTTPKPWKTALRREGARVGTNDIDGDGVESVVAMFRARRTAYLVVHAMHLEVSRSG